jgi:hypothetical protein
MAEAQRFGETCGAPPAMVDQLTKLLVLWFLTQYENPVESCPYLSAEGGYQWIWGGPYDAQEELESVWGGLFTTTFLARVARLLEEREGCHEWSGIPKE